MNTSSEQARLLYQRHLEDHFDEDNLERVLQTLELDTDIDEPAAMIQCILARLEEPGFLEEFIQGLSAGAFELLGKLLDRGHVHPPKSLKLELQDESSTDMSVLLGRMRHLGLFVVEVWWDQVILLIQPWLRYLLREALENRARARPAPPPLSPRADLPLHQILALCANYLRANTVRVTVEAQMHQRDQKKAESMFAQLDGGYYASIFWIAVQYLEGLGGISMSRGTLDLVVERTRELLDTDHELGFDVLGINNWDLPLALTLVDLLDQHSDQNDGWMNISQLMIHGEIFIAASQYFAMRKLDQRLNSVLTELTLLGLVSSAGEEYPRSNFRISPRGHQFLEQLRSSSKGPWLETGPAPLPQEKRAIVQPNLDILVPVDAPPRVHWRIGTVARLRAIDTMCRYTIEKKYAQCIFSREGSDADAWIEKLGACAAHGIPENITETLRSWLHGQSEVTVNCGTLITLSGDANDAGRTALSDAADKLKASELAPGVYLVDQMKHREQAVPILQKHGLRVSLEEEAKTFEEALDRQHSTGLISLRKLRADYEQAREVMRQFQEKISHLGDLGDVLLGQDGSGNAGQAEVAANTAPLFGPWIQRTGEDDSRGNGTNISAAIHQAVRTGHVIELVLDQHGQQHTWPLNPEAVLKRGSRIYLTGYCPETEELRAFPIDDIVSVRVSTQSVEG